jgi:hypothetical protein
MRIIEETLYNISELSEEAVQKAYGKWQENDYYCWHSENEGAMKAFADIFPVTVSGWQYGPYDRCYVKFRFNTDKIGNCSHWCEDSYEEMSGHRLAKFLFNNYWHHIAKGKYYSKLVQQGPKGSYYLSRYSKINLSTDGCPFTGYCADNYLIDPIVEFMKAPDSTTFPELMERCLENWAKCCGEDVEGATSLEAFKEDAEANNMEFYEDGTSY